MPGLNESTARENIITSNDITVTAREIDFVTSFARNWQHLQDIMRITRPIRMTPGTVLKSKYATGTLADPSQVGEGEFIPRSKYIVKEKDYDEITIDKYSKEVSIEAVKKWGADVAVDMTDDEFLVDLQDVVSNKFYARLKTGEHRTTFKEKTWQMAVAMSIGECKSAFKKMHRNITGVATWVNTLDVYAYLGSAEITVQQAFGFSYVENFMGADIAFLTDEIGRGEVISTPLNNIVAYSIDPADSDYAKLGLVYTTDGETNLIGFHAQGDYDHATGVSYAIMGLVLFAEYENGIVAATVDPNATEAETASSVNSTIHDEKSESLGE